MNRRALIKTLGISVVGLSTLPLWIDSWKPENLSIQGMPVTSDQKALLRILVDTVIPATETPGAAELEVDKFVLMMLNDCYEKEIQNSFISSLDNLNQACEDRYNIEFEEATQTQKEELIIYLENLPIDLEKKMNPMQLTKSLTILGYSTSEYVLTNILNYEFVPSRFHGSVPVEPPFLKKA